MPIDDPVCVPGTAMYPNPHKSSVKHWISSLCRLIEYVFKMRLKITNEMFNFKRSVLFLLYRI